MKTMNLLVLAAVAGTIGVSSADAKQLIFRRIPVNPSLSEYCSNNTNPFWIGNNPSAVEIYGDRVVVGGWNSSGVTGPIGATVIKSAWTFGDPAPAPYYTRSDTDVTNADKPSWPNGRQYTGFRFSPEAAAPSANSLSKANLIMFADGGSATPADQFQSYAFIDSSTSLAFIGSAPGANVRGNAGAWDLGFNGQGFTAPDNEVVPAAVAALSFSASAYWGLKPSTTISGDLALDRFTPAFTNAIGGAGDFRINNTSGSLYRSLDVDRDIAVARSGRALYLSKRNGSNVWSTTSNIGGSDGDLAFTSLHNIRILRGAPGQAKRVFIYNDQGAPSTAFAQVIKLANEDGAAVTAQWKNFDGTPFTLPADSTPNSTEITAIGTAWSFGWDGVYKRLALTNFANRALLVFQATTDCPADLNDDGFVDDSDFVIFAGAYNDLLTAGGPFGVGDFNGDAATDDTDFVAFASAYNDLLCPGSTN
ncbi:MAG: hypothetical protein K2Y21_13410 [Phycisphaerales bacterium]|nr:hypothetical protein [Phycisphaerales bacterium]